VTVCCPISGHYGDGAATCTDTSKPRARVEHTCCECHETIMPGMVYEKTTGIWDRRAETYKTCLSCVEIRDHFTCEGWFYGHVWSDLEENFFPDMTAGGPCMEGLSPEAKQRLIDRRMDWYVHKQARRPRGALPPPKSDT
jgi:hypothetical protein